MVAMKSNVVPLQRPATRSQETPEPTTPKRTRREFGKVRTLPSGRFQASYIGKDGTRHLAPVTFLTKTDAAAWLDMRHAELLEYRWKPAPPPEPERATFREYATGWLAEREIKPRTRSEYQRLLDRALLPAFGDAEVIQITTANVRDWYRTLDPGKPTERAHTYQLLRAILNGAVHDEVIPANPCRVRAAGTVKRAHHIEPATVDDLANIVDAMPERLRLAVLLGAWLAMRYGEIAELRRHDIDTVRGVVRVRRGVTWPDGKPTVGSPKTAAGVRDVHVPPHLTPALAEHLARHTGPGADALLFPAARGGHMHPRTFGKAFNTARTAAGRPGLRFHDLRHTGAVMAAQAGATLAELQGRLGHSTASAAMRYQHAAAGRDAEIARKLSAMVEGR